MSDTRFCHWCGNELEEGAIRGRPSVFCGTKHATQYHNELKRTMRQKKLLTSEALRINDNLARGGELALESMRLVQGLIPSLASTHAVDISCASCGQKRLLMPELHDRCTFCLGDEWKIKPLRKP